MNCRIRIVIIFFFFFFNDTATTEIYTLSLHDALPISPCGSYQPFQASDGGRGIAAGESVEAAAAVVVGGGEGRGAKPRFESSYPAPPGTHRPEDTPLGNLLEH